MSDWRRAFARRIYLQKSDCRYFFGCTRSYRHRRGTYAVDYAVLHCMFFTGCSGGSNSWDRQIGRTDACIFNRNLRRAPFVDICVLTDEQNLDKSVYCISVVLGGYLYCASGVICCLKKEIDSKSDKTKRPDSMLTHKSSPSSGFPTKYHRGLLL